MFLLLILAGRSWRVLMVDASHLMQQFRPVLVCIRVTGSVLLGLKREGVVVGGVVLRGSNARV